MKQIHLAFPELALIAGTRALAGAGLGMLLSTRLSERQRRTLGWALLAVGAASTLPLAWDVCLHRLESPHKDTERIDNTPRTEGQRGLAVAKELSRN